MSEKWKVTDEQKVIKEMLGAIGSSSAFLRNTVNTCAMSCVLHAVKHGNVTPATQLLEKLGDGWRLNALRHWFLAYGPFRWDVEEEAFYLHKGSREQYQAELSANSETFVGKMDSCPFWEFKPEAKFVGFDLKRELERLKAKAEKAEGETDENKKKKIKLKNLDKFQQFVATLQ